MHWCMCTPHGRMLDLSYAGRDIVVVILHTHINTLIVSRLGDARPSL